MWLQYQTMGLYLKHHLIPTVDHIRGNCFLDIINGTYVRQPFRLVLVTKEITLKKLPTSSTSVWVIMWEKKATLQCILHYVALRQSKTQLLEVLCWICCVFSQRADRKLWNLMTLYWMFVLSFKCMRYQHAFGLNYCTSGWRMHTVC